MKTKNYSCKDNQSIHFDKYRVNNNTMSAKHACKKRVVELKFKAAVAESACRWAV